jgi:hypothetical protein
VVPETDGNTVFEGGAGVTTIAVALDVAGVVPQMEVALTVARIVLPESAATRVYELAVAEPIVAQLAPAPSQRDHWYVYVNGLSAPVHVPVVVVRA